MYFNVILLYQFHLKIIERFQFHELKSRKNSFCRVFTVANFIEQFEYISFYEEFLNELLDTFKNNEIHRQQIHLLVNKSTNS